MLLVQGRPDLSEAERSELDEVIASLGTVPGVVDMTWGPDFSGRAKGYTHAAVLRFEGREALASYATDPIHLRAVEALNHLAPDRLVCDYETGTSGISA